MPEEVIDEGNPEPGSRVFQPMLPPDHPVFNEAMKMDVFDIVRSRQFHSENHLPVCFKYRSNKKCRFRFPRKLVPHTGFDESTGVILQKRDREWLNNYNRWFSLIMHTNHDSQYLFSQTEALAKIYYTMKYLSKTEESTYSKLTIAAAVTKELARSARDVSSKGKSMLIRTFNKISSHREVGIPEAISHLLDFPDTLTGATFENIHTTHLLNHLKTLNGERDEIAATDMGDSSIVHVRNRATIISVFDDYAHRGPHLADMCLYDYCALVYKSKNAGGLPYESAHPQHLTHRQFVRKQTVTIPTLLGRLLFLRPDSGDEVVREHHFCLITGLFVPWTNSQLPRKPANESWERFFSSKKSYLSPRVLRYIDNLALLHKSKEEAHIDQLRLHAQYGNDEDDNDGDAYTSHAHFDTLSDDDEDNDWDFAANNTTRSLAVVQSALEGALDSADIYVREAMDANCVNGYFDNTRESPAPSIDVPSFQIYEQSSDVPIFMPVDTKVLAKWLKNAEMREEIRIRDLQNEDVTPGVFLTGSDITSLIRDFSLNTNQARAFRIICNHALGHHLPTDLQLLMGVFGEGGTGKSRLIEAIRVWFKRNGRGNELIVAATTGTAAVKIKGSTVHSAVSIPIEIENGNRLGKLSPAQLEAWTERRYMVIDEISMMDCKIMEYLHTQLAIAKARPDVSFGGVNIIFFGDFLQLPAVRNPDLYIDSKEWGAGHRLWRSLNAVVILKEQMRQAGDPLYASLLSRLRLRVPTDEDIEILRSRIGARLSNMQSVPAIVRRHALRHAMNMRRLHEAETKSDSHIIYCVADITDVAGMSMLEAHQIRFGDRGSRVEAIVPLLRGAPLLVTRNISKPLGMYPYLPHLTKL